MPHRMAFLNLSEISEMTNNPNPSKQTTSLQSAEFKSDGIGHWTPDADDPAILRCQGMFNRVLSSWASDLLRLRREGLSAPGWREQVQTEEGIAWKRAA